MEYLINADDYGRTHYTNKAIVEGFEQGYLDRTTIMVNTEAYDEAVELAKKNGFFDCIGLHFNLTTGYPLTDEIKQLRSFCNKDGAFNSKIFHSKRIRMFLFPSEIRAVKKELSAQIDKYKRAGFCLMHFDSHGHIHTFPSLMPICYCLICKRGFHSVRLTLNYSACGIKRVLKKIENVVFNSLNQKYNKRMTYFDSVQIALKSFEREKDKSGLFEVMVHPDYRNRVDVQIELRCKYSDLKILGPYRVK